MAKSPQHRGILRTIVTSLLSLTGIVLLGLGALLLYLTWVEYYPQEDIPLTQIGQESDSYRTGDTLTILSWNIGYGALGENADFFMDGGTSVNTATEEEVRANMTAILEEIEDESPDIVLLQEIDRKSTRSHRINELQMIAAYNPEYQYTFASNLKVPFIPYPIPPIGKVDSGIATFTSAAMSESVRVPLPCPFSRPIRIANLKRCLMVSRIPIENSSGNLSS